MPATLHELCHLTSEGRDPVLCEVVAFDQGVAQLMPYHDPQRLPSDADVIGLGRHFSVPVGPGLRGRVLDGLGNPLDGRGPLRDVRRLAAANEVPPVLSRRRVDRPLTTGQRAIDSVLTLGQGQRVGLFAGSGVGKSTLLGEIAKYADVRQNVIVLVGERGREVRPFIEDCLGPAGLERSVVIVSTSDESALMRIRAVQTGINIATQLRDEGADVLFLLDSLTRLAMAQRELGLSVGEPPTARGYTPSVFQLLARTLEQLGNSEHGSITALLTVLVDGDDMNDPIADAVRSIVDGHIVLKRELAERGHFPAIDINASISRVFTDVASPEQQQMARLMRAHLAIFYANIDLIRTGAYEPGHSPELDRAIQLVPSIETFLRQDIDEFSDADQTIRRMRETLAPLHSAASGATAGR